MNERLEVFWVLDPRCERQTDAQARACV